RARTGETCVRLCAQAVKTRATRTSRRPNMRQILVRAMDKSTELNILPRMSEPALAPGRLLYGGAHHEAQSGRTFQAINPATRARLARVAKAGAEDVDAAVRAARTAFEAGAWPKLTGDDRSKLLWKLGDLIEQHKDELARLETLDAGKPIRDTTNVDI